MSPAAAPQPVRVALLFHSLTSGNLGVGALTVGNMALAEEAARAEGLEPEFVCVGMRDGDTPPIGGGRIPTIVVDRRNLLSPGGLWRTFGRCDVALDISGGDSFADIYAPRRFFFILAVKLLALARRVPIILSPQTIGPFERLRNRRIAGYIMRRCRAVLARDPRSFEFARELAPDANVILTTDVAFRLPFTDHSARRGGARLRVGVNVSGLLWKEAEDGTNRFGLSVDYVRYTRALIAALLARGAEVHLLTHAFTRTQPHDDDALRADLVAAEFPEAIRVPDFLHPSDAKSHISGLDALVAGRMHACIGAFSSGTPVVPVAYSRKFDGLFGSLGYRWMVPVTGMDDAEALRFTLDAVDRRAELAADIAGGMRQVDGLLARYVGELRALFRDVATGRAR